MRNTKIYFVVAKLEKKEQKKFLHFLQSPYYNRSKDLVVIYQMMLTYLSGVRKTDLSKEKIWKKIQPKKKYDDVRFRKHLSELFKLMEQFLSLQVYEESSLQQKNDLLFAISERRLEKIYSKSVRNTEKLYEDFPHKQASYYLNKYRFESNLYKLNSFDTKRTERSNLPKIIENLDYFYFNERLRLVNSLERRDLLTNAESNGLFTEKIFALIDDADFKETPAISIYYQLYLMSMFSNENKHYYELKELLQKHYSNFASEEAYDMYTAAVSYCIERVNKGDSTFLKELFLLHKELVNNKLYFSRKAGFRPAAFRNIIVTALRLNEFEWAEDFIRDYQQYLPEASRENAVAFNLATLYFYQKKYPEVIDQLRNVEFEDFSYNLNSKTILLATYYETDEIEPLYSLFDSFSTFLKRQKKLAHERKMPYLDLIRYVRRLTRLAPSDTKSLEKIETEVDSNPKIASRKWLKEKIQEAKINGIR